MRMKPTSVDEYLAAAPEFARPTLEQLRQRIKQLVPEAVEVFAYGMPGFKYQGKALVYLGGWKAHCALHGLPADLHRAELAAYDLDKGTIRFQPDHPLPDALLQALLNDRIAAIEASGSTRKPRRA
jgi:uncharacterized protein YdhG (YjbR/CyaY superfamily)